MTCYKFRERARRKRQPASKHALIKKRVREAVLRQDARRDKLREIMDAMLEERGRGRMIDFVVTEMLREPPVREVVGFNGGMPLDWR